MSPYGTVEGQTAQIAEYIAELIRAHGHQAETADLKHAGDTLPDGYDGVIVAASVHMGKHEGHVTDFVKKNRGELERLPSALVSVSLAAHGDEENAEGYVAKFEEETGWRPAHVGLFAGALLYTHYGFIKKHRDEEDRQGQGLPGHGHHPGLRLHRVGRRPAVHRGLSGAAGRAQSGPRPG